MNKIQNKTRRNLIKNSAKIASLALFASPLVAQTTQTAQKNSKLFNKDANLAKTDPEFMEIYSNFALDEVLEESKSLNLQTRLKLILAALVATQGRSEFKNMLNSALKNGVEPVEIKEILYQATAYAGAGKSIDFIVLCNEVFRAKGISLPLEPQKNVAYSKRQEWGLQVQRTLFGESIDKANAAAPEDIKHIRRFLSANCFGDFYTRGGLSLNFRELLTLVLLVSLGGADAQVKAHVRANLNIGHSRAYLIEVFTALIPYIGYPRTLNALAALDELSLQK